MAVAVRIVDFSEALNSDLNDVSGNEKRYLQVETSQSHYSEDPSPQRRKPGIVRVAL